MSALVDFEIRELIRSGSFKVDPFDPELIRPASLSLRLGRSASMLSTDHPVDAADPRSYPGLVDLPLDGHGRLAVEPGRLVLAATLERIALPSNVFGFVDGISDTARLGLTVVLSHFVNPGYGASAGAVLTLEICSRLPQPIYLYPGTRICNLVLWRCATPEGQYSALPVNHSHDVRETASRWWAQHPGNRTS